MTDDDTRPIERRTWKFVPIWMPTGMPNWAPNPLAAIALFALEAMIVLALALIGFGVAAMALWVL